MMIYHITSRAGWDAAQVRGSYTADSLASEGFIHASTREQVIGTASRYYQGQTGLVLLEINVDELIPELRFDELPNGMKFPHIYGALNLNAVTHVYDFPPSQDGTFQLPAALQE